MYLPVYLERTLQPVLEESLNILSSHLPIIQLPSMWALLSSTSEAIENFTQNTILEVWKELLEKKKEKKRLSLTSIGSNWDKWAIKNQFSGWPGQSHGSITEFGIDTMNTWIG